MNSKTIATIMCICAMYSVQNLLAQGVLGKMKAKLEEAGVQTSSIGPAGGFKEQTNPQSIFDKNTLTYNSGEAKVGDADRSFNYYNAIYSNFSFGKSIFHNGKYYTFSMNGLAGSRIEYTYKLNGSEIEISTYSYANKQKTFKGKISNNKRQLKMEFKVEDGSFFVLYDLAPKQEFELQDLKKGVRCADIFLSPNKKLYYGISNLGSNSPNQDGTYCYGLYQDTLSVFYKRVSYAGNKFNYISFPVEKIDAKLLTVIKEGSSYAIKITLKEDIKKEIVSDLGTETESVKEVFLYYGIWTAKYVKSNLDSIESKFSSSQKSEFAKQKSQLYNNLNTWIQEDISENEYYSQKAQESRKNTESNSSGSTSKSTTSSSSSKKEEKIRIEFQNKNGSDDVYLVFENNKGHTGTGRVGKGQITTYYFSSGAIVKYKNGGTIMTVSSSNDGKRIQLN